MKPETTWILIADGSGARILEALGGGNYFSEHSVSGGHRSVSDAETAPPRHVLEDRPRAVKILESLFAHQLGSMLTEHLRNAAFDRLILIAPSAMLSELRKMLSPAVREKVILEIEKDLTDVPIAEISNYIGNANSY